MEKNAKIGTFFYKEQKNTQRSKRSFEKKGCPTLPNCCFCNHSTLQPQQLQSNAAITAGPRPMGHTL